MLYQIQTGNKPYPGLRFLFWDDCFMLSLGKLLKCLTEELSRGALNIFPLPKGKGLQKQWIGFDSDPRPRFHNILQNEWYPEA